MILTYDGDWSIASSTEQHAFRMTECYLPESEQAIYIAFPWASLFQHADNPADQKQLFAHIEKLKNILSLLKNKKIVTVFQSKCFSQYKTLFLDLGITDIFWCHTKVGDSLLDNTSIRLWPFPTLASGSYNHSAWGNRPHLLASSKSYSAATFSTFHYCNHISIADAKFFLLADSNSSLIWTCIEHETIPVVTDTTFLPPGNKALWQTAVVFCERSDKATQNLSNGLELLSNNEEEYLNKLHAIRQLKLLYGKDYFIFDIVKFLISPENFLQENSNQRPIFSLNQSLITESYSPIEDSNIFILSFISKMLASKGKHKHKLIDLNYKVKLLSALEQADKKNTILCGKIMIFYKVELV